MKAAEPVPESVLRALGDTEAGGEDGINSRGAEGSIGVSGS